MTHRLVFNPTDTPQPANDEGGIVGAHDWNIADTKAAQVKAALDDKRLSTVELGEDPRPELADLAAEADRLNTAPAAKAARVKE